MIINKEVIDRIFKVKVKRTDEDHEILLFKAYNSLVSGCEVVSIDKEVPDVEKNMYQQYDKLVRVIFLTPQGEKKQMYTSYHFSGNERGKYFERKYLQAMEENKRLQDIILRNIERGK